MRLEKSSKFESQTNFRIQRENLEREYLSKRAARSSESKGRKKSEEPCQIRTAFQMDRDRILHSKAFRRLKHKTQVFIAPEGDHYRTRLTHTLEVNIIARTIASALRLNEDLTESIALAHDLGHPPFGHAGEESLDQIMLDHDFDPGFHHNIQSVRVVEEIENDGKGLNLTFETIDGIRHHTKGMGDITSGISDGELPYTEEGRIVRISDRIAYLAADLEDSIRAGIIEEDDIPVILHKSLIDSPWGIRNHIIADVIQHSSNTGWVSISEETVSLMNSLKDFLFDKVYNNPKVIDRNPKVKTLISLLFESFALNDKLYDEYVKIHFDNEKKKLRNICDYIAGMTDQYAVTTFERLYLPKSWEHY